MVNATILRFPVYVDSRKEIANQAGVMKVVLDI